MENWIERWFGRLEAQNGFGFKVMRSFIQQYYDWKTAGWILKDTFLEIP